MITILKAYHHCRIDLQIVERNRLARCKPPSIIRISGFVDNQRKWAIVAREVNFGGSVASVIWVEQPTIETTTRTGIPVRNYVVHA